MRCGAPAPAGRLTPWMHAGVEDLWVSLETGFVVVAGSGLDASQLKWRIQSRTGKHVAVVSDGTEDNQPQMVHLGPPQGYGYGYGGGASWVPAPHALHQYEAARRQHLANEAPARFHDDNPNGCCVMQ